MMAVGIILGVVGVVLVGTGVRNRLAAMASIGALILGALVYAGHPMGAPMVLAAGADLIIFGSCCTRPIAGLAGWVMALAGISLL